MDYGLRISRFAADLKEIADRMGLDRLILMGHSMGCSIIWSYLDLFGPERVDALLDELRVADPDPADVEPVIYQRPDRDAYARMAPGESAATGAGVFGTERA